MNDEPIDVKEPKPLSKSKLLLPGDQVIVASTSLAFGFGLERAVILQQLHFLLGNKRNGKTINGSRWIYNTYKQWKKDHLPWMSLMTIRRRFCELEKMEAIDSCQPELSFSRRKYYRLSDKLLDALAKAAGQTPSVQSEPSSCSTRTTGKGSE
jgi:hypothetical protein